MAANKKPLLIVLAAAMSVCAVVMLAGIAMIVFKMGDISGKETKFNRVDRQYRDLVNQGEELSLSQENIEAGEALQKASFAASFERFKILTAPYRFDSKPGGPADPTAFNSMLQDQSQRLAERCQKAGVQLTGDSRFFGFSRYLKNGDKAPQDKLGVLCCQYEVVSKVVEILARSTEERTKMLRAANVLEPDKAVWTKLISVTRQASEFPNEQKRNMAKDEMTLKVKKNGGEVGLVELEDSSGKTNEIRTFCRDKYSWAFAVQFRVATDTGVIRDLVNELRKYSIYIADIKVVPASENVFPRQKQDDRNVSAPADGGLDFGFFGGAPAAPSASAPRAPAKKLVVEEAPSDFVITMEYFSAFTFEEMNAKMEIAEKEEGAAE
ncbi:MAG: Amuc_1100 family pilus-like protein [Opitutales bacterium]|nr:Amuc_1100 family pilus-like protein [Opitutales bacterium]